MWALPIPEDDLWTSQAIFETRMNQTFVNCNGVIFIADDIVECRDSEATSDATCGRWPVDVKKQVWSWTPESDFSNKTKSTSTESPAVKMASNQILDPCWVWLTTWVHLYPTWACNSTVTRISHWQITILLEGYIPRSSRQNQGIHKQRSNIYLLRPKETNSLSSRRIASWPWRSFVTR